MALIAVTDLNILFRELIEFRLNLFKPHLGIKFVSPNQTSFTESQLPIMFDTEGNDSNLLIVFYVQIMPDDFVMQL
ncbi:hypothetical protein, partial [Escherichia coli]|uniref:hypothetical protein n=1 Tax=Escherichia coli TaxID=562 RepID=UPI003F50BE04